MVMPKQPKRPKEIVGEYRFRIDAYTPDTMPMHRLAQYMTELSQLLGERDAVHFRRLEEGSTVLVHKIEREAIPKVRARVARVRTGDAPAEAVRSYKTINKMLRDDDAVAVLKDEKKTGIIIRFPGRELVEEEFASVKQYGSIDGIVTWVGGTDETAHITLETEGQQVSRIFTTRAIAKALGSKLFEPVRLHGHGRWSRDGDGNWSLYSFRVESFQPLDDTPLSEALEQLRGVPFKWGNQAFIELDTIRHGPKGQKKGNGNGGN
jgi:hypothetical protein